MKRSRIIVMADAAGSGPHYHVGDEAMAEVALERIKAIVGRENIVLACPHPRTARAAYDVKAIAMPLRSAKTWAFHLLINPVVIGFRIGRLLWHLYRSDLVFKAGGGNIRGKWSKFPLLSLARSMRKPVMLVSQTLGPFKGNHRKVLQKQLAEALWIGVRDRTFSGEQSGLPVHFAPDDAVYLRPRHNSTTSRLVQDHPLLVGIAFADCKGVDEGVLSAVYQTMEGIVARLNAVALFIPHHAPRGRGDCESARNLTEQWRSVQAVLLDRALPAEAVMALTGELKLVIANRYHGIIFGLTMGVPTVALHHDEYTEAKMRGAFEQFNLPPSTVAVTEAPLRLWDAASAALDARNVFASAAHETLANGRAANLAPYEMLQAFINTK